MPAEDDYAAAGKPACDYDDEAARVELVDALARDAHARADCARRPRPGPERSTRPPRCWPPWSARTSTPTRRACFGSPGGSPRTGSISTVDPEARHGHKTSARGFDGYKGHVAIDPDSEMITATAVTAGNIGDAAAATDLLTADLPSATQTPTQDVAEDAAEDTAIADASTADGDDPLAVYGDSAYAPGSCWRSCKPLAPRAGARCSPDRGRWPVHQRRLRHRPDQTRSDLSGRANRATATRQARLDGLLRRGLRILPSPGNAQAAPK